MLSICSWALSRDERLTEVLRELGCAYIQIASIALDMETSDLQIHRSGDLSFGAASVGTYNAQSGQRLEHNATAPA